MNQALRGSLRYRRIQRCILISGLSVFAQLYLFQPLLAGLAEAFGVGLATSSLTVSVSTLGMAAGLFVLTFAADAFRREWLMSFTLIVSSVLTILSATAGSFSVLLALCFLKGFVLSGVSAVALSYLAEEVSAGVIGVAMSMYLSGNTLGGMSGRVFSALVAGWTDWRWAAASLGAVSLGLGILFARRIPRARWHTPRKIAVTTKIKQMRRLLRTPLFIGLYGVAALIMGTFVSVYNYLSSLLESPRFGLPHYLVAMIFMMYTVGVAGSMIAGRLSDRRDPAWLLRRALLFMLFGVALLFFQSLVSIILGLGVLTFAFFSAHTLASRIVSLHAGAAKSSATCLYWLFYYAGSSLAGWATGLVLGACGWTFFVLSLTVLTAMAWGIAKKAKLSYENS